MYNDRHPVTCLSLCDGTISIRLYGHEIALLPNRRELTIRDLEVALIKLVVAAEDLWVHSDQETVMEEAFEQVENELSRWDYA